MPLHPKFGQLSWQCALYSGMAKVGVVPVNDTQLQTGWHENLAVQRVNRSLAKSKCCKVLLVLVLCLDFLIFVLFRLDNRHCLREIDIRVAVEFVNGVDFGVL
jgi:hypothetical protein